MNVPAISKNFSLFCLKKSFKWNVLCYAYNWTYQQFQKISKSLFRAKTNVVEWNLLSPFEHLIGYCIMVSYKLRRNDQCNLYKISRNDKWMSKLIRKSFWMETRNEYWYIYRIVFDIHVWQHNKVIMFLYTNITLSVLSKHWSHHMWTWGKLCLTSNTSSQAWINFVFTPNLYFHSW